MCRFLAFSSILILLLSCGRTNTDVREYAVDVNEKPDADSLFLKTTYVMLESSEDCIVGDISCVKCSEKYLAVQSKYDIHVFDRKGRHVSSITRKGHGHGEYVSFSDYAICGDTLFVLNRESERLYLYQARTGKFLCKKALGAGYCHLLPLNGRQMLLSSENCNATRYNLATFDLERNSCEKHALPFLKEEGISFSQFFPFGKMGDGSPSYCLPFDYNVYGMRGSEWTPLYRFTFNTTKQLPPDKEEKSFIELSDVCCNQDVVQYIEHFRETRQFLYLDYSVFSEYGVTHCLSRISRDRGNCITARLSNRRYPGLPYCFTTPVGFEDDKIITAHNAFPLLQYEKENGLDLFLGLVLKKENNPVVFFTTIN